MIREHCIAEVVPNLRRGDRVRLPDGEHGIVVEQKRDIVSVEQPQRVLGRGPWTFERWQLEQL